LRGRRRFAAAWIGLTVVLSAIAGPAAAGQGKPPKYVFWPMKRFPLISYQGRINGIGAAAGNRYYFVTSAAMVHAVDLAQLEALWQSDPKAKDPSYSVAANSSVIAWQFQSKAPVSFPPVPAGDMLVVVDDLGDVTGLDAKGQTAWIASTGEPPASGPLALGEKILIRRRDGLYSVLEVKTGKAEAPLTAGGEPSEFACVFDEQLYAALKGGDIVVLGPDGKEMERIKSGVAYKGPLTVSKEAILAGKAGGFVEFYDRIKGKPRWSRRLGGAFRKLEFMGDARVCVMGANDVLFCLSSRSGNLIWWRGGTLLDIPMPMFWQGRIAATFATREIFGLVDRTGEPRWRFDVGTKIVGDLHPWGGNMAVHMYDEKSDRGFFQLMGPAAPDK